jgi:CRP-like cAMP-binding protein/uncharacterized membrane protein YdbT with pleckstrin-like domain
MENNSTAYIPLLKLQYLFQDLDDNQLELVVKKFEVEPVSPSDVIISQREAGRFFYVIAKGKVGVIQTAGRKKQQLNILKPGDYFGEEALLFRQPNKADYISYSRTILLRLNYEQFFELLQEFPEIKQILLATAESRQLLRRERYPWLGEDEVIQLVRRKHEVFLFRSLILPIFIWVISIPVLVVSFASGDTSLSGIAIKVVGALMFFGSMLWGVWKYLDWGNDYYIVTNQRVIWSEKVIGLYDSRSEAPLDTILAVNVTSSWLGRILNYGNVTVRTFTGGFTMRNMSKPNRFASYVEGFKRRIEAVSAVEEAHEMQRELEHSLRQQLDMPEVSVPEEEEFIPPIPLKEERPEEKKSGLREKMQNFLKVRYEEGDSITYRKHWFVLFNKLFWSLVVLFLVVMLLAFLGFGVEFFSGATLSLLGAGLLFVVFLWMIYEYVDWRNDIYRVTPDQIFDIERKPLGQEVKKTAPLESILSVEHERESLLGILLNFGTVTINVGETKFQFFNVFNPDQVHQDVSDYREGLNRRKRMAEQERERKRMVDWLVTYYGEAEKIDEELENESSWEQFSG